MFSHKHHNFLHAQPLHGRKRHPAVKAVTVAFIVLAVIAGITALVVLPFWFLAERIYTSAEAGKRDLETSQELAQQGELASAAAHAAMAHQEFSDSHDQVKRLLFLGGLPVVGAHIRAADGLLSSGSAASSALAELLTVADKLTSTLQKSEGLSAALAGSLPDAAKLFKELTPGQKREVLASFSESAPQMRQALTDIDDALIAFDSIPQGEIAEQFAAALLPMRPKLLQLRQALALLLPVAERAPAVLGYPEARRYLIFFQNNTELRPTGGFLGVYGLAVVKDADIVELTTDDIYSLDGPAEATERPPAPAAIQKYIGIQKWFLRDANWSPDFVASSRTMAQFYAQEFEVARKSPAPSIDGVIAVDTEVAKDVLRITGPLTVQGKTFTADNVVDTLEFAVEKGFVSQGIDVDNRKQIVAELVRAVIEKLESLPLQQLIASLEVAKRNLDEGHVLLAMRDPELENAILDKDWGGVLKPVRGDYLMWIDANLAALKSDPAVQRTVNYGVSQGADGQWYGTAKMTYKHVGRFDWKTTRYRTYARVFVPAGSQFVSVAGAMENDKIKDPARRVGKADVGAELGRAWFGAFISIEPGETRTLEFRYKLAPSVVEDLTIGQYALDVEKQPGTVSHGLTLDLNLGKKLKTAQPAEDRTQWGDALYRVNTDLRLDREFEVSF